MYYGNQDVTLFCSYFILTDLSSTFPDSIGRGSVGTLRSSGDLIVWLIGLILCMG